MSEKDTPTTTTHRTDYEGQAATFVLGIFDQQQDARLVFHNYELCLQTVQVAHQLMAPLPDLAFAKKQAIALAAWFINAGYAYDVHQPLPHTMRELRRFFAQADIPEEVRMDVVQYIQTVGKQQQPASEPEKILSDAWLSASYLQEPEERLALQRLEWDLLDIRHPDKLEWLEIQQEQMLQIRLYTHPAKEAFEPARTRYLMQVRDKLHKQRNKQSEPQPAKQEHKLFGGLEGDDPRRATQTFFRSNYRNHINLSAIADNKANIMISVNSILISVLITFLSYRNIGETQPMILLPVVIFLVTGLVSLIFAVLSARPKVTMLHNTPDIPQPERRKNLVFFGNFVSMDLHDYEEAMDEVFRDSSLMYGNMVRDLYHLGKVLEKKYRYLTVSYNIFMVGFIATVLTFLVALFT